MALARSYKAELVNKYKLSADSASYKAFVSTPSRAAALYENA